MSLARNAAMARAAGQSYGQYMAAQYKPPEVLVPATAERQFCRICSQPLRGRQSQYCSPDCGYLAQRRRQKEAYQRKKGERA